MERVRLAAVTDRGHAESERTSRADREEELVQQGKRRMQLKEEGKGRSRRTILQSQQFSVKELLLKQLECIAMQAAVPV